MGWPQERQLSTIRLPRCLVSILTSGMSKSLDTRRGNFRAATLPVTPTRTWNCFFTKGAAAGQGALDSMWALMASNPGSLPRRASTRLCQDLKSKSRIRGTHFIHMFDQSVLSTLGQKPGLLRGEQAQRLGTYDLMRRSGTVSYGPVL